MIVFQVFLPFAFGYFLSYLFRVVNAVIAPNLISDLGLTAAATTSKEASTFRGP